MTAGFFVKINSDATLQKHVLVGQENDVFVSNRWQLGYINNNGYRSINPQTGVTKFDANTADNQDLDPYDGVDYNGNTVQYNYTTGVRSVTCSGLHPTENLHHTQTSGNGGLNQNKYWWGDGNSPTEGSVNSSAATLYSVTQNEIDDNPLYALNDYKNGESSQEFWKAVRAKYMFFIDAATAFSWTGYKDDGPGMIGDGNDDLIWDQDTLSHAANATDFAPDGDFSNTKKVKVNQVEVYGPRLMTQIYLIWIYHGQEWATTLVYMDSLITRRFSIN